MARKRRKQERVFQPSSLLLIAALVVVIIGGWRISRDKEATLSTRPRVPLDAFSPVDARPVGDASLVSNGGGCSLANDWLASTNSELVPYSSVPWSCMCTPVINDRISCQFPDGQTGVDKFDLIVVGDRVVDAEVTQPAPHIAAGELFGPCLANRTCAAYSSIYNPSAGFRLTCNRGVCDYALGSFKGKCRDAPDGAKCDRGLYCSGYRCYQNR